MRSRKASLLTIFFCMLVLVFSMQSRLTVHLRAEGPARATSSSTLCDARMSDNVVPDVLETVVLIVFGLTFVASRNLCRIPFTVDSAALRLSDLRPYRFLRPPPDFRCSRA